MDSATQRLRQIGRAIQRLVLPPSCLLCQGSCETQPASPLCDECLKQVACRDVTRCRRCSARFPELRFDTPLLDDCRHCRHLGLPFATSYCIGNYQGPIQALVRHMKTRGRDGTACQMGCWLGHLWVEDAGESLEVPQLIVPVPTHWTRRLSRGCNLAELICTGLIQSLPEPRPVCRALKSVRPTQKQGTLTSRQRFENVRNCFAVPRPSEIAGKSIALVDDVMTSGATAIQASRTLLRAGASSVSYLFLARGIGATL